MVRYTFFILIFFLFGCHHPGEKPFENKQPDTPITETDMSDTEYKLTTRFYAFDTTVEVLFTDTRDSISETQKKNYDGFIAKQDLLAPDILKKVFEFYKESYADYKEGWTMAGGLSYQELEKYLPTPTTPENMKPFITPAIVHIQNKQDCKEGTIGIEFDCTWDIKSGLGVKIENWKVVNASVAEIAYF